MLGWWIGILALLGSALFNGAASGFNLVDLCLLSLVAVIGGVDQGVLVLVSLRWVLGFLSRTRGFIGLVDLVTVGACGGASSPSAPSVSSFSPSVVGSGPPLTMISIAFLIS